MLETQNATTHELEQHFGEAMRDAGLCLYPHTAPPNFDWKQFRRWPDAYSAEPLLRDAVLALWHIGKRTDWDKECRDPGQNGLYREALKDAMIPLQAVRRRDKADRRWNEEHDEKETSLDELHMEAMMSRGVYHWLKQINEWYGISYAI